MTEPAETTSGASHRDDRERRLEAVIAEYIRACESGSPPDRSYLLERHGNLAAELRQFFAQRDRIDRLAEPIRGFREDLFQAITPGQHIGYVGNYELLEEVARGGMGIVYKARQTTLGRIVAVKMIVAGRLATEDDVQRFQAEAQAAANLQHPHIVPIHEVGQHEGWHYFSMDYIAGRNLGAIIRENVLSPRQAAEYVCQMAEAIHYAHLQGTLHRDLKPSNVLVDLEDRIHVTDFGLAMRVEGNSELTRTGQIVGTPSYMPPEQALGKRSLIGAASDVYSLGAVLYECLTGRPPFRAESSLETIQQVVHTDAASPRVLNPGIPRDLETICLKCLHKEPHRRYGTAQQLAEDLQRFLDDRPILARPPSLAYRFSRFTRRNRAAVSITSVVAAGLVIAVVMLAISNALIRKEQDRTRYERSVAVAAQRTAEHRSEQLRQSVLDLQTAHRLLERGRTSLEEQSWDDADAAYTRAIELRPENGGPWAARADLYLRLGLFDLAEHDLDRACRLQTEVVIWRWMALAMLHLNIADVQGVHDVRAHMWSHIREVGTPRFTGDAVRVATLVPDPDVDYLDLAEMAQKLADEDRGNAFVRYLLGLAQFRAGHFEQADAELQQALTLWPSWEARRMAFAIRAMAYYRLGRAADARIALNEAARAIDDWTSQACQTNNVGWDIHQGVGSWPVAWWDWLECRLFYREASVLIDGVPPPEDPRLHLIRARAFAGLRHTGQAIEEYDAALAALPDDRQIQFERCRTRGYFYGYRDWRQSAREVAEARRLMPDLVKIWKYEAVANLAADNREGYRQVCTDLLDRFATTQDPSTANDVVVTCVLEPDAVLNPHLLLPLGQLAAERHLGNSRVLGAACYRAGQYAEAVRQLDDSARLIEPRGWDLCFLAMAHHRLGHVEEAQHCLQSAAHWIAEANLQTTVGFHYRQQVWGEFTERFEFPLLYAEGAALIGGSDQAATPSLPVSGSPSSKAAPQTTPRS